MKNVSIPDDLADRVEAAGVDLRNFAVEAIEQKLDRDAGAESKTLEQMLASGWKLPTVKGKPRNDGLAWSEVEASTDAA